MRRPAFLRSVRSVPERIPRDGGFPFCLPFVATLDLQLSSAVTLFVGENGSGKSTLLKAIAALSSLPVRGGSRAELDHSHAPDVDSGLADALRPAFSTRPRDGYFFRAEFQAHFATLLDERSADPEFGDNPYAIYGGRSLHRRSHGEAFMDIFLNRARSGLYLMDEPESALSPQRQLALLARMADLVAHEQQVQFIIATHSPILLTYPGATIVSFDDTQLPTVALEDTSHFQITKGILDCPARSGVTSRTARDPQVASMAPPALLPNHSIKRTPIGRAGPSPVEFCVGCGAGGARAVPWPAGRARAASSSLEARS